MHNRKAPAETKPDPSAPGLRDLPAIERVLKDPTLEPTVHEFGEHSVKHALRGLQAQMRDRREVPTWATEPSGYILPIRERLAKIAYTPIFNLTGTIVHTNLGRALLSQEVWRQVEPLVTRPMNLEYDLRLGRRGDRDAVVEERLCRLTGCEAATIVNNNAAALMLVLNTFALGRSVPVSRGELVEIGGSFRLPELMQRAGCRLLEVGTTNRTRIDDFADVAGEAAMLLKIHPSNFYIEGFTEAVDAGALAALAKEHDIPSCVDLGSGSLIPLEQWGLPGEPTPQAALHQGVDLVTYSGDKLLGGVQSGIIAGRRDLIEQIRKNPMKRALRADKITLAVLEATLKLYDNPQTLAENLPLLRTLLLEPDTLHDRAGTLGPRLPPSLQWEIVPSTVQIGSGALPDKTIPSVALALTHPTLGAEALANALRDLPTPVIGRIHDEVLLLDMRGAEPLEELGEMLASLPL